MTKKTISTGAAALVLLAGLVYPISAYANQSQDSSQQQAALVGAQSSFDISQSQDQVQAQPEQTQEQSQETTVSGEESAVIEVQQSNNLSTVKTLPDTGSQQTRYLYLVGLIAVGAATHRLPKT